MKKTFVSIVLALVLPFAVSFVSEVRGLDQTSAINQMIENVAPAVYCFDCAFQISICEHLEWEMGLYQSLCGIYGPNDPYDYCNRAERLIFLTGQCWNSVDLNCNYPDI